MAKGPRIQAPRGRWPGADRQGADGQEADGFRAHVLFWIVHAIDILSKFCMFQTTSPQPTEVVCWGSN